MGTDSTLLITVMVFFILLGTVLPFIDAATGADITTHNADELSPQVDEQDFNVINGLDVFLSILTVLFWSFSVPFYVNLLFIEPFRILAYYLIIRWIRGI